MTDELKPQSMEAAWAAFRENISCIDAYVQPMEIAFAAAWYTRPPDPRIAELEAELDRLRTRLEVVPGMGDNCDGISARNEIIRLRDDYIDHLRAELAQAKAKGEKLAEAAKRYRGSVYDYTTIGPHNRQLFGAIANERRDAAKGLNQALIEWSET